MRGDLLLVAVNCSLSYHYRNLAQALSSDESGETMDALDLYNQALSTIRSGLAVLRSSVGEEPAADSALHDIKAKMEK